MTGSLVGRKVRLTGPAWQGNEWTPARGTVHTIIEPDMARTEAGAVYIEHGEWTCYVFIDAGQSLDPMEHDWSGELVTGAALEVRPYAVGFLDGMVGLDMQTAGEEYERGYLRGSDVASRLP